MVITGVYNLAKTRTMYSVPNDYVDQMFTQNK